MSRRAKTYRWNPETRHMEYLGEHKLRNKTPRIDKPTRIRTLEDEPIIESERQFNELCAKLSDEGTDFVE